MVSDWIVYQKGWAPLLTPPAMDKVPSNDLSKELEWRGAFMDL